MRSGQVTLFERKQNSQCDVTCHQVVELDVVEGVHFDLLLELGTVRHEHGLTREHENGTFAAENTAALCELGHLVLTCMLL